MLGVFLEIILATLNHMIRIDACGNCASMSHKKGDPRLDMTISPPESSCFWNLGMDTGILQDQCLGTTPEVAFDGMNWDFLQTSTSWAQKCWVGTVGLEVLHLSKPAP